jgi:hypothetical protein
MLADIFTKPLQGEPFRKFQTLLVNKNANTPLVTRLEHGKALLVFSKTA